MPIFFAYHTSSSQGIDRSPPENRIWPFQSGISGRVYKYRFDYSGEWIFSSALSPVELDEKRGDAGRSWRSHRRSAITPDSFVICFRSRKKIVPSRDQIRF